MKAIRLLFTSVGRRVELIQAFKAAAANLKADLVIYGADADDTAPALYFCDRQIHVCRISDPCYISDLLSICQYEQIDCLIPTIDTDLLLLAESKQQFAEAGTRVLISEPDRIKVCRDKRLTSQYFIDCGLQAPLPVDDIRLYSGGFPCFIKPLNGSSSINAFRVDNQKDLEQRAAQIFDYIIQPFIEGTEYTVDIFCDFTGNPLLITPRERVTVRAGEVLKTRICQDEKIIADCKMLIERFCPCGPLTVQLIRQKDTGEDYYIEINPRFGGGAPLSMKAGADAAEVLLRMLDGQEVAYCDHAAVDGMVYSRFDQSICTNTDAKTATLQAVIFDLDDTLYSEVEYVRSGFKAVSRVLLQVENVEARLWSAFEKGLPAIDTILIEESLTDQKAECLYAYRTHKPSINLRTGMKELLEQLRKEGFALGIITDVRPEGQRAKIEALVLEPLVDQVIITDELGGAAFRKPCDIAFRIMQRRMGIPFESMVYVADNASKDFIAPRQLGMKCLHYKCSDGLYQNSSGGIPSVAEPHAVYSYITELTNNYAGGGTIMEKTITR